MFVEGRSMEDLRERADVLRKTLEKSRANTEKIKTVLGTFDRRLSTIDSALRPIQEILPGNMKCHDNVGKSLRKVEVVVSQFDQIREAEVAISKGPGDDLDKFLEAINQLLRISRFFNSRKSYAATESTLLHVNSLLSKAIKTTEYEFNKMMSALSKPMDPMKLFDCLPSNAKSLSTADQDNSGNPDSVDETETETNKEMPEYKLPTLISPRYIPRLHNLAVRLVLVGHHMQCLDIYREARVNALHQSLHSLGVQMLETDELNKLSWANIEAKLSMWIDFLRISFRLLFAGERKLCDHVFEGIEESFVDQCFVEVTSSSVAWLLSFGEAVVKMKKAPEIAFKYLDMYETMSELAPEIEAMFSSKECRTMLQSIIGLRKSLVLAISETLSEFPAMILKDGDKPRDDGRVLPLTSYVMNYLKYLLDYHEVLASLSVEHKSEDGESLQLAPLFLQILQALQSNLEAKSKLMKDQGQSHVFVMNNIYYMITSVRKTESAVKLLGDDWIPRQRKVVQLNANQYRRTSWSKVLESISSQGLLFSSGGSGNPMENSLSTSASKGVIKERFRKFNALFEEQYQKQCLWNVHDPELRESVSLSVAELLLPAYRSFMLRFGPMVENSKNKCIKYSPEDIERMLGELFQGKPSG